MWQVQPLSIIQLDKSFWKGVEVGIFYNFRPAFPYLTILIWMEELEGVVLESNIMCWVELALLPF